MSNSVVGRWAALRSIQPHGDDPARLFAALTPMSDNPGIHLQGSTPRPEEFIDGLWRSAYAIWVVCTPSDHTARGIVALTSVDTRNGFGFFSIVVDRERAPIGFGAEAAALAIRYIFDTFPLRLLLFDVAESVYRRRFASGAGRYFDVDGVRPQLVFTNGRYEDVYLLSMSRQRWIDCGAPQLDRLQRGRG